MKIKLNVLRTAVKTMLAEAKKKKSKTKSKKDKDQKVVQPHGYTHSETFDFSAPLGDLNRYKIQGASGIGPYTSSDSALEEMNDPWGALEEVIDPKGNGIWETLSRQVSKK